MSTKPKSETFDAVRPFRQSGRFVADANGDRVLICSVEYDCGARYAERLVDAEAHFICPKCGRFGQRMEEMLSSHSDLATK